MTSRSGNIAKWMGENVEEIVRDSQDRAIDLYGGNGCEMMHVWVDPKLTQNREGWRKAIMAMVRKGKPPTHAACVADRHS